MSHSLTCPLFYFFCLSVAAAPLAPSLLPLKCGHTPLIHASWYGHMGIAAMLIDRGADVDMLPNVKDHVSLKRGLGGDNKTNTEMKTPGCVWWLWGDKNKRYYYEVGGGIDNRQGVYQ